MVHKHTRAFKLKVIIVGVVVAVLGVGVFTGLFLSGADARLGIASSDSPLQVHSRAQPVDDVIALPAAEFADLTLIHTAIQPLMSKDEAIEITANFGSPPAISDTVTATFGLATFGWFDSPTQSWIGIQNVPMPSGETLSRIENRPMWIVDYGDMAVDGAGCPECAPASFNHLVYAVDVRTKAILFTWAYSED